MRAQMNARSGRWTVFFLTGLANLALFLSAAHAAPQIKPVQNAIKAPTLNTQTGAFHFEAATVLPSKVQGQVMSSGVQWTCKGNVCTTRVKYPGFGVKACHALALQIGQVRSFRLTKQPPTLVPIKGYPFRADKIAKCNQGISVPKSTTFNSRLSSPVIGGVAVLNTGTIGSGTQAGQAASRAGKIGEAGNRMKQIKELERLNDLGTPADQAMGRGAAGRQDCSHSANRAKCLRDNMNAGNAPAGPSGGSMRDCIMGSNPQNCFNSGGGKRPGQLNAGPSDPRGQIKDPRGVASGDSDQEPVGVWIRGGSRTERRGDQGRTEYTSEYRHNTDGTTDTVYVRTTYRERETQSDVVLFERVTKTKRNARGEIIENSSDASDPDRPYEMRSPAPDTPPDSDPAGQSAPDTASGGAPDNCNRDLVTGRCKNPQPDPKGATSQPGPGGENTGGILGRNTPKTDIGAAINCGDVNNDACNRAGVGLNNAARPLDMKDPGPAPGAAPH